MISTFTAFSAQQKDIKKYNYLFFYQLLDDINYFTYLPLIKIAVNSKSI